MKTLHLISLGCTKNLIDSEVMLSKLSDYALSDDASTADLIIVNSCGFIQSAKEESLNTIFELHENRKKESLLVMSGCFSQRYKDELQDELPEIDIFTGVGDYDKIDELVREKKSRFSNRVFLMSDIDTRTVSGSNYHAYIKLSEGCNQQCSFCAIPSFKGKLLSRSIESVVKEVKALVKNGFFDFSFVSQDSSSYARDLGNKKGLIELINEIDKIDGVKSARVLYLYPYTTNDELIKAIANSKKFHTYYDMPLQHISSSMLKKMKRGKGSEKLKELLSLMKSQPDNFVRSTFIVGHPGETAEEFDELCEFIKEYGFDRANIFSYSDEEGTSAYMMDNKVDQKTIDTRAEILGDIISQITHKKLLNYIGKTIEIVVDGESSEHEYLLSSRALSWAPDIDGEIYVNDKEIDGDIEYGKIYKATITELIGDKLTATIIGE
jgi:ribosomal protein S12 methylthiotransferase